MLVHQRSERHRTLSGTYGQHKRGFVGPRMLALVLLLLVLLISTGCLARSDANQETEQSTDLEQRLHILEHQNERFRSERDSLREQLWQMADEKAELESELKRAREEERAGTQQMETALKLQTSSANQLAYRLALLVVEQLQQGETELVEALAGPDGPVVYWSTATTWEETSVGDDGAEEDNSLDPIIRWVRDTGVPAHQLEHFFLESVSGFHNVVFEIPLQAEDHSAYLWVQFDNEGRLHRLSAEFRNPVGSPY